MDGTREGRKERKGSVRRENDGLADHLALGILRDVDGVGTGARGTADEFTLVCRGPAAVADVAGGNLLGVGVGGVTGEHAEALG